MTRRNQQNFNNQRNMNNQYRRGGEWSAMGRNQSRFQDRGQDLGQRRLYRDRDQYSEDYGNSYGEDFRGNMDRDYDLGRRFGDYDRDMSDRGYGQRDWDRGGSYSGGQGLHEGQDLGSRLSNIGSRIGEFVGRGPKGYRRSDDRIREDICERLSDHPEIDASDIEIEVKNSDVTLKGNVPERRMKRLAEDLAESISGVNDVHNQIRARATSASATGNQETTASRKSAA